MICLLSSATLLQELNLDEPSEPLSTHDILWFYYFTQVFNKLMKISSLPLFKWRVSIRFINYFYFLYIMHYSLPIIEVSLTKKTKAKFPEASRLAFQEYLAQVCSKRKITLSIWSAAIAEEWKRPMERPAGFYCSCVDLLYCLLKQHHIKKGRQLVAMQVDNTVLRANVQVP